MKNVFETRTKGKKKRKIFPFSLFLLWHSPETESHIKKEANANGKEKSTRSAEMQSLTELNDFEASVKRERRMERRDNKFSSDKNDPHSTLFFLSLSHVFHSRSRGKFKARI